MKTKLNIFEYIDFRAYLHDWRESEKMVNSGFTHEYLSAKLGQKNRSFFSDIENGRRTVGPDILDRLIKLIGLTGNEAKYFRAIVGYGQPSTYNEKEYWFEQAIQLNNTPKKIIDNSTYIFFKKWYHTTIRAYLETCNFKDEYNEVSKKLYGRVSPKEVKEAIDNLRELGLIAPNEKGFHKPTDKILTTGEPVKNELLRQFQLSNHEVLRTILEQDEPGTHESSTHTISISQKGMERIIHRIRHLRSEIMSIVHKDEDPADRVYKITIHTYPESTRTEL